MDASSAERWQARFLAPVISMPDWSPHAPARTVYESTESGVWQVHCWDAALGTTRQVTDHPVGVISGSPTLDGEGVIYWQDETGSEAGAWFVEPFRGGDRAPFLDGVPEGWNQGLAQAPGVVAAVISDRDGFGVFVSLDGDPAKEVARSPDLWCCVIAGVPVAEYEMSFADLSPELQAYDRALLGGSPEDIPELMRDRNPINFVDRVRAPVIFIIGENDSRCPPRQALVYVDKPRELGGEHEVVLFGTGHSSFDMDEEVRQVQAILDFLKRHVPAL